MADDGEGGRVSPRRLQQAYRDGYLPRSRWWQYAVVWGLAAVALAGWSDRALIEPLERLLGDSALRRSMGEAGLRRLETAFSVGKMVEETIGFYEGIVAGRSVG